MKTDEEIAKEEKIPVIKLHDALSNHADLFPDTIHPNAEGAKLIAQTVANALLGRKIEYNE